MVVRKPELSYNEFIAFKNDYLRDSGHHLSFGHAFCQKFGIGNDAIRNAIGVVAARVLIDEYVEWTF